MFDRKGALYSTTEGGDNGTAPDAVFRLAPPAKGKTAWTFATLYTFPGNNNEEASKLVFDQTGNIYGTNQGGGNSTCAATATSGGGKKCGTVFKLDPATQTLTTLHAFTGGADGGKSHGGLTINYLANGAFVLYGATAQGGGKSNAGTVFELDPSTHALTTLHAFTGGADGGNPMSGLVFNGGSLYGTTVYGGDSTACGGEGCGTVFKLTPPAKGHTAWTETVLHTFTGAADGAGPLSTLVFDTKGALYGTAFAGGDDTACRDNSGFLNLPPNPPPGCGVAFKLTP